MPAGAVYVGRPTKWGNPFVVGERYSPVATPLVWPYVVKTLPGSAAGFVSLRIVNHSTAVDAFTWWLYEQPPLMLSLPDLAGRDLVCWCPLDQPCHAEVLLELANQKEDPHA